MIAVDGSVAMVHLSLSAHWPDQITATTLTVTAWTSPFRSLVVGSCSALLLLVFFGAGGCCWLAGCWVVFCGVGGAVWFFAGQVAGGGAGCCLVSCWCCLAAGLDVRQRGVAGRCRIWLLLFLPARGWVLSCRTRWFLLSGCLTPGLAWCSRCRVGGRAGTASVHHTVAGATSSAFSSSSLPLSPPFRRFPCACPDGRDGHRPAGGRCPAAVPRRRDTPSRYW